MGWSSQTDIMHQQRNCPVRFGGFQKNVKNTDFDKKNQIIRMSVESFGWFMSVMVFVMRKTQINFN